MLQPGELLGIYRLIGRLGAGGMGEVWKGEDTRLGRTVAIKILPPAVAADSQAIARLRREARMAAQLNHPNIAMIHAFEEVGERLFIVMEYVDGEPLSHVLRRGKMAEADLCRVGRSIAEALAEAHEKGIVHRDIKPDNVIVSGTRVKVLDFGIAKAIAGSQIAGANDPTAFHTQQGVIIGTVSYMSPEQAMGKALDARSDLFSLGVVMYEAATGVLPFRGETATETLFQIARDEPPPPAGIAPALAAIIMRCLRKNRDQRYASARELAQALDEQLGIAPTAPFTNDATLPRRAAVPMTAPPTMPAPAPQTPPRLWPWITAVVALLIAGGISGFVLTRPKPAPAPAAVVATTSAPATAPTTTVDVVTSSAPEPEPPPPSLPERVVTTTAAPAPAPVPVSAPPTRSADDHYNEGVAHLASREGALARQALMRALEADPAHARAHFRLGEMALFLRQMLIAKRHFDQALANADRLSPRERKLTELALAAIARDPDRVRQLAQQIDAEYPNDPELARFRALLEREREGQRPFRRKRP